MAFEGVPVPGGQAERRSERAPLVVVEQGPVEVSPHVDTVVHRVVHAGYGVEGVIDSPAVIGSGDAIFGDDYRRASGGRCSRLAYAENAALLFP